MPAIAMITDPMCVAFGIPSTLLNMLAVRIYAAGGLTAYRVIRGKA